MSGRGFDFLLATLLHLLLHKSAIFSHVVRYKNSLGTRIIGFFCDYSKYGLVHDTGFEPVTPAV